MSGASGEHDFVRINVGGVIDKLRDMAAELGELDVIAWELDDLGQKEQSEALRSAARELAQLRTCALVEARAALRDHAVAEPEPEPVQ